MDLKLAMKRYLSGEAENHEIAAISGVIRDFKDSDAFAILKMNADGVIRTMLEVGRTAQVPAEFQLGKLEGIQYFETAVDGIIQAGIVAKSNMEDEGQVKDYPIIEEEQLVEKPKRRKR